MHILYIFRLTCRHFYYFIECLFNNACDYIGFKNNMILNPIFYDSFKYIYVDSQLRW